jgi:hypothetical protein
MKRKNTYDIHILRKENPKINKYWYFFSISNFKVDKPLEI